MKIKTISLAVALASLGLMNSANAALSKACETLLDAQVGCTITAKNFDDEVAKSVIKIFKGDNINRYHLVERDFSETDSSKPGYWGYEAGDYTSPIQSLVPVSYTEEQLHGAMERLVIFVDGLNPDGEETVTSRFQRLKEAASGMYNTMKSSAQNAAELAALSNSIILLADGMVHGGDSIEDNAYLVQDILKFASENRILRKNITVVGVSSGGVVARYALADLENKGQYHDVGTYISYDAPHRGANIPQSIQNLLPVMSSTIGKVNGYVNKNFSAVKKIGGFDVKLDAVIGDGGVTDQIKASIDEATGQTLTSKMGSQLLLNSVIDTLPQYTFQQKLDEIGYPASTVNVAVTNGSIYGTALDNSAYPLNPDGSYFLFDGRGGLTKDFKFLSCLSKATDDYAFMNLKLFPTVPGEVNLQTNVGVNALMTCSFIFVAGEVRLFKDFPEFRRTPSEVVSYDEVAGSYMHLNALLSASYKDNKYDKNGKLIFNQRDNYTGDDITSPAHFYNQRKFTFIPTFSALDIAVAQDQLDEPLDVDSVINESQWDHVFVADESDGLLLETNFPKVDDNYYHVQLNADSGLVSTLVDGLNLDPLSATDKLLVWLSQPNRNWPDIISAIESVLGEGLVPTPLLMAVVTHSYTGGKFGSVDVLLALGMSEELIAGTAANIAQSYEMVALLSDFDKEGCNALGLDEDICNKLSTGENVVAAN
ncbi:PGAP1-like protein [Sinobacterium caligoides]|uniref:PGAP1-like protein n=1 Tax=Sinobacterium caligoides TaxID=933926 RepID=A0A3N2DPT0_9GAMM|nr:hypothetical protein [Sinobacterium caligoides]ROS01692.1 PGAP1-like protein [Sinobacterium caligoides]